MNEPTSHFEFAKALAQDAAAVAGNMNEPTQVQTEASGEWKVVRHSYQFEDGWDVLDDDGMVVGNFIMHLAEKVAAAHNAAHQRDQERIERTEQLLTTYRQQLAVATERERQLAAAVQAKDELIREVLKFVHDAYGCREKLQDALAIQPATSALADRKDSE